MCNSVSSLLVTISPSFLRSRMLQVLQQTLSRSIFAELASPLLFLSLQLLTYPLLQWLWCGHIYNNHQKNKKNMNNTHKKKKKKDLDLYIAQ